MVIYLITNTVNSKVYVGQTSRTLDARIREHHNRAGKQNNHMSRAFAKHGFDNFRFTITDIAQTVEELNEKEAMWISVFDSSNRLKGYNLELGGHNYKRTDEVCKRMSEGQKGKPMAHASLANLENGRPYKAVVCSDCVRTQRFTSLAAFNKESGKHSQHYFRKYGFVMHDGMKCQKEVA